MTVVYDLSDASNNASMTDVGEQAAPNTTALISTDVYVQTELFTVLTTLLLLLTAALLGASFNLTLLAATRCKRSIRNLYYGLFYNMSAVNTLLCLGWTPLLLAQLASNYNGQVGGRVLCYVNQCLFHLLVAALVISVTLLTTQRVVHLCRLSAQDTHHIALAGIAASWLGAVAAAVAVAVDVPHTLQYAVCLLASWPATRVDELTASRASAVLVTLYFALLITALIVLLVAIIIKRQILTQLISIKVTAQGHGEGQEVSTGSDHMCSSQQQSSLLSDTQNPSPTPSTTGSMASGQVATKNTHKQEGDDDDDEEDTFDLKMRLKHKNSGRRHTVANIGLGGSLSGGRRSSLGTMSDRSPTNYQYVRKWSVDIVALQNQLENPKSTDGGYPFQELQRLQLLDANKTNRSMTDSIMTDSIQEDAPSTSPHEERASKKPKKKKTVQLDNRIEEIEDPRDMMDASSPDLLPSIIVNGNGRSSPTEEADGDEERFGRRRMPSLPLSQQQHAINDELLQQIHKELSKSSKLIVLLLLLIVTIIPGVLVQVVIGLSDQLTYNLTHLSTALILIQAPITPLILTWLDPRLQQAASHLKANLTSWQCVCYCNIGKSKGQTCFARPNQYKATAVSKA